MEFTEERFPKFEDLVREAGLRSLRWSPLSYYAGKHYHWIVAAFTTLILVASFAGRVPWWFAVGGSGLYVIYVAARKSLPPDLERKFYQRDVQFIRAELAFLFITLILVAVPFTTQSNVWLLFVPVILLTSKRCRTWQFAIMVGEACLILLAVRVQQQTLATPVDWLDLLSTWLWIGLLSFILHYLIRNIEARSQTIASYDFVNILANQVDVTATSAEQQWQPLLDALVRTTEGSCATVWLVDRQTGYLQRVASVLRGGVDPIMIVPWTPAEDTPIAPEDRALIATVTRTGQPDHTSDPTAMTSRAVCPAVASEFAVPIEIGAGEQRAMLGALSVGFQKRAYKPRLRQSYSIFMQGLVNQAKPMLIYTRRLEEIMALQNIGRQVSHSLDLTVVLDAILHAIVDTLGFQFAIISLVDEERQEIRAARGLNVSDEWLAMCQHHLSDKDIQADIVRTGQCEVLTEWDERFDRAIWDKFDHGNMVRVFMPIAVLDAATGRDRVIGTIEAGHYRGQRSTIAPYELRMLEAFEDQAAVAIEHAQLLQRTRQHAEVLASLHVVGQSLALARDPRTVLHEIGGQAQTLLKADLVMLYRYHRATNEVDAPLIFGEVEPGFKPLLSMGQHNLLTHLLRDTQTPHYEPAAAQIDQPIGSESAAPAERSGRTFIQEEHIQSLAGIPLVINGETLGVMFINYRARQSFDDDERQLHELFAQQAAAALKNAESNELTRQLIVRGERDHLSRELHQSVAQALFGIGLKADTLADVMERHKPALAAEAALIASTAQREAGKITEMVEMAGRDLSFLINELRRPLDESQHLVTGLEEYARRLNRWFDASVKLEIANCPLLPPETEQVLLRLAREALNNAVRHAHSQTIVVRLGVETDVMRLIVQDDGCGFDQSWVPEEKWGLKNMNELAQQIKARLSIESEIEVGTRVSVELSLTSGGTRQ
jgi:signal transduction histidine kinase